MLSKSMVKLLFFFCDEAWLRDCSGSEAVPERSGGMEPEGGTTESPTAHFCAVSPKNS